MLQCVPAARPMPVLNSDIAYSLDKLADLLEIQGANPFRIRAYRNAARIVGELGRDVRGMVDKGEDLPALPGIGDNLAAKMREILASGSCALLSTTCVSASVRRGAP